MEAIGQQTPPPLTGPTDAEAVQVLLRGRSVLTLVGGALVVVGALLPWVTIAWASATGLDGDGRVTLGAAAGALAVAAAGPLGPWRRTLCLVLGIAITALAVFHIANFSTVAAEMAADPENAFKVTVRIGPGLYATAAGGVGILFGGLLGR